MGDFFLATEMSSLGVVLSVQEAVRRVVPVMQLSELG